MENILNYALQINVLLTVVYLGYAFLLKNLTFYRLNRVYFLTGIVFSFVYPFLDIQSWFSKPIPSVGEIAMDWSIFMDQDVEQSFFTLNNILIIILGIGIAILFIRFLIQMISLLRIHIYSEPAQWQSYLFRNVFIPIVPFSFLNKIYVNRDHHAEPELMDIFKHEDIHVKGLHSIDILISEFTLISSWFNPFVWLMRKAIRENLEFLTDQQVLNNGVDRQSYQYSLLRVNSNSSTAILGNQFSFKTLKKRIMMMNKKRSAKMQMSKYAFMLPVFVLTAAAFTLNKAEAKITQAIDVAKDMSLDVQLPTEEKLKELEHIPIKKDSLSTGEISLNDIDFKKNYLFRIDVKVASAQEIKALKQDEVVNVNFYKQGNFSVSHVDDLDKDGLVIVHTKKALAEKGRLKEEAQKRARLFLIDGKEVSLSELKEFDTKNAKSFKMLKKVEGFEKYGDKGKNGVFEIYTDRSSEMAGFNRLQGKATDVALRGKKVFLPEKNNIQLNSSTKGTPLYIVDGDVYVEDFKTIDQNNIRAIHIFKGQSAIDKYGEKAKHGAIAITTKSGSEFKSVSIDTADKKSVKLLKFGKTGKVKPLIVVDGAVKDDAFEINELKTSDIEHIEVFKDASATALYGARAESGAIVITTKKNKANGDNSSSTKTNSSIPDIADKKGLLPSSVVISDNKNPLFLIDGEAMAEVFDIKSINPNNIESVTVNKNNKLTAIYGSRANNGVVNIVTKSANKRSR